MKNCIIVLVFVLSLVSCGTKYNYIDTGTASPHFNGNMYEYLQSDSYNWDSVRLMIDRAGLREVFMHDDITFMGLTNHSIRKWLILDGSGHKQGYSRISDIPEGMCRAIVLSLVVDGKVLRDQIERVEFDAEGLHVGGGRKVQTRYGNTIWLWTKQGAYIGVPGLGPVSLHMTALKDDGGEISTSEIASGDIQPTNGVVHALEYRYNIDYIGQLTEMK